MRADRPILAVSAIGGVRRTEDGKSFTVRTRYQLNESDIDTTTTRQRKKDVLPAVERAHADALSGSLTATFLDGRFVGTKLSVSIGAKR